jgi:AraC-like DNA-binding protein
MNSLPSSVFDIKNLPGYYPPQIDITHTLCMEIINGTLYAARNLQLINDADYQCLAIHQKQRQPMARLLNLLGMLEQRSGDPAIGLRLGSVIEPGFFGIIGYLAKTAATIGDAHRITQSHHSLAIDCSECYSIIDSRSTTLAWSPLGDEYQYRPFIDLIMMSIHRFGWLTGASPKNLTRISFQYPKPDDTRIHQQLFGLEPTFSRSQNTITHDDSWLSTPLQTKDSLLHGMLLLDARQQLNNLRKQRSTRWNVRQVLTNLLPNGIANLPAMASELNLSSRTLQRQLREEDISYQSVLNNARFNIASIFLEYSCLPISSIAERLGYCDAPTFSHAMKKFTGISPQAFREKSLTP